MVVKLTKAETEEITECAQKWATLVGLSPSDKARFRKFALAYYSNLKGRVSPSSWSVDQFCESWSVSFWKKTEYFNAVRETSYALVTLIKVDSLKGARARLAIQFKKWGGYDTKSAREKANALNRYGKFQD